MKFAALASATAVVAASLAASAGATWTSPVSKAIELIASLHAQVVKEGEQAQQHYEKNAEWCQDRSRNLGHEIKTGQAEVQTLKATVEMETSTLMALTSKVEDLAASITVNDADLKSATDIRDAEEKDFGNAQEDLVDTISMLSRAIGLIEREMAHGHASMLQTPGVQSMAQALTALVKASVMNEADMTRLTALLQNSKKRASEEADDTNDVVDAYLVGAPAASVYKSQSGNILEVLRGLLDDAEIQLDDARKKETANRHNFEMLRQSLQDEVEFGNKDLAEAKKNIAITGEAKSTAEGDLAVTSKSLEADLETKATLHRDCMQKAATFEVETKSRNEELKALAASKNALVEATAGAADISYGLNQVSPSFLQQRASNQAALRSSADLVHFEALQIVRDLARKDKSAALTQLAQRMQIALGAGSGASSSSLGADPFAKVKSLIMNMIHTLEAAAGAEATEKAYCDKELAETRFKQEDKTGAIAKQTRRIDQMSSRSSVLKEEVADLQDALAKLAASQAEMTKLRREAHEVFVANKADMEKGLEGVKAALKILNEYYASDDAAHDAAAGSGESIIGLLEVVESDFAKDLAEIDSNEDVAVAEYEQETKDNAIERTMKGKDVEYKTKEMNHLNKEAADLSSDRATVQMELAAVQEYLKRMEQRCIAKAETYEERRRHRASEIAGLKDALKVLSTEAALLQRGAHGNLRRGGAAAAAV